jgi:predicted TIM-barrel fold metal-dependent hydrolase
MPNPTPVIDSQIHCYERNGPERPWAGTLHGPEEVTGADMVAFMDRAGIDGALLVSPWAMYRYDASYAQLAHTGHPHRFALIKPFDPSEPAVGEQVEEWARQQGVVGARLMLGAPASTDADPAGVDRILKAATQTGLPVNVLCWGNLAKFASLAARHPDTQLVIDHLGMLQPFEPPAPKRPFRDLAKVVELAQFANVAIKVSGACTLSHEGYPFDDIWEPLAQIFAAFGFERCLWGTDWTRAVEVVDPLQSVQAFRNTSFLSPTEKDALMGGSLSAVYGWAPGSPIASH